MATRLAGSNDLYEQGGRRPHASINFVTSHDGFTLNDLVSYNDKHNEANLDHNRDGESNNQSWNCGAEGPVDDPEILALRQRQKRNFLATLLLSHGVPMLCGGDEMGRTQHGNNNGYCLDNELSWLHWDLDDEARALARFTSRLIALRLGEPVFHRRKFFQGRGIRGANIKDISWLTPQGVEMTDESWNAEAVRSLGVLLAGTAIDEFDDRGRTIVGNTLLLLMNAHHETTPFVLPPSGSDYRWVRLFDTVNADAPEARFVGGRRYPLHARSVVVFRLDKFAGRVSARGGEPSGKPGMQGRG